MCRLFGFRSQVAVNAHHSLVEAENALRIQSRAHPDGWGLGYYEDAVPRLYKGVTPAFEDESYSDLCETLSSNTVIAHVRQATVGEVSEVNTHPFRHENWLFAHNGTVYGFSQLRPFFLEEIPEHLRSRIAGHTDSEHCFYLFLAELEALCDLDNADVESVRQAMITCLQKVASWCRLMGIRKAPCMNFLIANGRLFAASRLGRDLFFSTQKYRCPDFAHCTDPTRHCMGQRHPEVPVTHLLVASERISLDDVWEEVPNNALLLVDGHMNFRIERDVVCLTNLEFAPMPVSLNGTNIAN